jgi:hypothetical protein
VSFHETHLRLPRREHTGGVVIPRNVIRLRVPAWVSDSADALEILTLCFLDGDRR